MQLVNAILAFASAAFALATVGVTHVPGPLNPSDPFLLLAHGNNINSGVSVDQRGYLTVEGDQKQFTVDANNILRSNSGGVVTLMPGSQSIFLSHGDFVPSGYPFKGYSLEDGTGNLKLNIDGAAYNFVVCQENRVHAVKAGENIDDECESVEIQSTVINSP